LRSGVGLEALIRFDLVGAARMTFRPVFHGSWCLQQPQREQPQQDHDEEMLVPHQDAIEGPQQDVVEGPQPMEGELFSCHLTLHLLEFFFANTSSLKHSSSFLFFMVIYGTVRAIAQFFHNHNFYAWFLPL